MCVCVSVPGFDVVSEIVREKSDNDGSAIAIYWDDPTDQPEMAFRINVSIFQMIWFHTQVVA